MNKNLIIYFSRADENYFSGQMQYISKGNTEVLAEYIQKLTGADIFKVEPLNPYAKDYETCIKEAKERQASHDASIKGELPDISSYDTIYVGSPVYWGIMPEELSMTLKNYDYTGKMIRPFITHEGSGSASIPSELREICTGATIGEAIAIVGSSVNTAEDKIKNWL